MELNQDNSCIVIWKKTKFFIYSIDPFKCLSINDIEYDILCIEMLLRSNILLIVGVINPTRVCLWDAYLEKNIGILNVSNPIIRTKLTMNYILIICLFRTYLYDFNSFMKLHSIETVKNKKGLGCICQHSCNKLFVLLGLKIGEIKIANEEKSVLINAHKTKINCVALNFEGTKLASASKTGTIIRVFDTFSGEVLHELKRGNEIANIFSLTFHETSEWLAVSSNLKTIHIFHLLGNEEIENPKSYFSFLKSSILPNTINVLLSREWSFHRFIINEQPFLLVFSTGNILCIFTNGIYYKVEFGKNTKPFQLEQIAIS